MLAKEIKSLQHPIVKMVFKLRTSRKFRYEKKQIVLVGKKLVFEAKKLDLILIKKECSHPFSSIPTCYVNEAILKKITGLESPEPFAAIAPMPSWHNLKKKDWILALDGIQDPGNLGTLLRTALALNWEGAFLTENCVDPYNDKALRSAKGATLRLPMQMGTKEDLYQLAKGKSVWVADINGTPLPAIKKSSQAILILGNEATGVSQILKQHFEKVTIPIQKIESLNVAAAGAILLYDLKT